MQRAAAVSRQLPLEKDVGPPGSSSSSPAQHGTPCNGRLKESAAGTVSALLQELCCFRLYKASVCVHRDLEQHPWCVFCFAFLSAPSASFQEAEGGCTPSQSLLASLPATHTARCCVTGARHSGSLTAEALGPHRLLCCVCHELRILAWLLGPWSFWAKAVPTGRQRRGAGVQT